MNGCTDVLMYMYMYYQVYSVLVLFKSSLRDLFAIDGNVPNQQQQQLAATPFIPPPTKEEYRQEETKIPDEEQKLSQKQLEEVGGYTDDFFSIFVRSCSLSSSYCKQKKTMMLKQPKWLRAEVAADLAEFDEQFSSQNLTATNDNDVSSFCR